MSIELELTKAGRVKLTSKFARECINDLFHEAMIGLSGTVLQEHDIGRYFEDFCDTVDEDKLLAPEEAASLRELADKIDVLVKDFCNLGDKANRTYVEHLDSILNDRDKLEAYIKRRFDAMPKLK
ncbi:MAG: hypothetical protein NC218_08310 [Acetobacter sp.]|nr:hypothetical protein [Acetobacter sp.]